MLRPLLICGRSFKIQEEDEFSFSPFAPQQRRSIKTCKLVSRSRKSRKNSKNPYASRGLDKFSELLANIAEKKQRIYLSKNSRNISFVRFVYSSSSDDVVPIVVKSKDKKNQVMFSEVLKQEKPTTPVSVATETCLATEKMINLENLKHPSYYVPAFTILILLLLAVFGRSAAILFTSIGWYLVPTITGDTLKAKTKLGKKRGYIRKFNENNTIAIDGLKQKELMRKFSEIQMVSNNNGVVSSPKIQNNIGRTSMKINSAHRKSF